MGERNKVAPKWKKDEISKVFEKQLRNFWFSDFHKFKTYTHTTVQNSPGSIGAFVCVCVCLCL